MKLAWLQAETAGARRAATLLAALLVASMATNLALAALALATSGRERVVLVPPAVHKTFWVESDRVSAEYLEQMAYFLLQLTLNVTPHSVVHQSQTLLRYADPGTWGELRTTLATSAERIRRDGASTVFAARDIVVDAKNLRVGIRGTLTTFISDRRVSEVARGYAVELGYAQGRLTLKALRETLANDPLTAIEAAPGARSTGPTGRGQAAPGDAGSLPVDPGAMAPPANPSSPDGAANR
jgi:conjugal transfer pilus assembly protein TraE